MHKVTMDEIIDLNRYAEKRKEIRRSIIDLKKNRRVSVGGRVSFLFENHDTVLFQIQEMLWTERITDPEKIRSEIDTYNQLIPAAGELSTTMFIEIEDKSRVREELNAMSGIDEAVFLEINRSGERVIIPGMFEFGRSREDKISAVQHVRFAVGDHWRTIADPDWRVALTIRYPTYRASAFILGIVRRTLAHDLAEDARMDKTREMPVPTKY